MIYIFTALYCEAQIFIRQFHLKKNLMSTRFQEFDNEETGIRLILTGSGEIAAATAVGSVCTACQPKEKDILLNIGTCAQTGGSLGVFLCNKIIEQATEKAFYPDILYHHPFSEGTIVTGMKTWNNEGDSPMALTTEGKLYDMEAAAIYQAGSCFFGPHQMVFVKIVSDGGAANRISERQIYNLMERYQNKLFEFVEKLCEYSHADAGTEGDITCYREAFMTKLCADLHCSKAMRDSLAQHIHYLTLEGVEYVPVIQEMYREGLLPCKDKREGKLRFEEFKRRVY